MIRNYRLEDKTYIINSHYQIYNEEYQYDASFRTFIKETVEGFINRADTREGIWILEIEGVPKGSISIKRVDDSTAQLGLFLIEPSLRGAGMGRKLMQTAIDFSSKIGYQSIILWTNRELAKARLIYEHYGFRLVETRRQRLSNKILTEEKWRLIL